MASKPGILTEWPWTRLGSFKYLVLSPFIIRATYLYMIWISISRYRTAKGSNRIVDKSIEFEQVDRERSWDDQIIFSGILVYLGSMYLQGADNVPIWRTDGLVITFLLHATLIEFLYYWLHRALHHHFLYSRYHSHHHSSIVTEPITSVIHPFAEHIAYFALFATPMIVTIRLGTISIASVAGYITFVDVMNNLGHCNFELIPNWLFSVFPPLKYIMYTPSFHSLHHTQFRTNYSLFMPFYDYIYGTMDSSTDSLYEKSVQRKEESPDMIYLTHLTTPESIYHLRLGFAALASKPYNVTWYLWLMWPVTLWSMMVTWIYGRTFTIERNVFERLKLQTWAIPKYKIQYWLEWQRESINNLIEEAILEAEVKGTKVLCLGLLNQGEELNRNGETYIRKYPSLKVKLIDGSSLAVAVVLNSIPKGTNGVVLRGKLSKVACAIAQALCQEGIKVNLLHEDEYKKLKARLSNEAGNSLVLCKGIAPKTWLVGDGLSENDQMKASKGALFIPFSQFPPKKLRKDCFYHTTPAILAPKLLENVDSCENWLPRRVMSAWRVAGILHALEGWNVHECGDMIFSIDKIWQASLKHGFRPLPVSTEPKQY